MASLDSLPADQKAVLSLVLQRGRTFDEIAALLSIDRAAVRQRALEGFDALGPDTTLDPLKRALITDYLLGQLPPAVAGSVRASLQANPPERAWARVIAAEVGPLAVNGLPEIPAAAARDSDAATATDGARGSGPAASREASTESPASARSARRAASSERAANAPTALAAPATGDRPPSSRRGGAILLGLVALAAVVVVVVLLVTGGSSKHPRTLTSAATNAGATATTAATTTAGTLASAGTGTGTGAKPTATALHQINLTSPTSTKGRQGAADVVRAGGRLGLVLVAEGLVANTNNAYAVWLYNSHTGAADRLGFYNKKVSASGTTKGQLEAEVALPSGATKYNELLLTLETAENTTKPGTIVLEGTFAE